jgi:hypothetical protein
LLQKQYFDCQRLQHAGLDGRMPQGAVRMLTHVARESAETTAGAVAQHLVGAKLSIRLSRREISNESYTTADQSTDRLGDFLVRDIAFHVTLSPSDTLVSSRHRCNPQDAYRVIVLMPEGSISAVRQLAGNAGPTNRVAVVSIEDFVGRNIEELGVFAEQSMREVLKNSA